MGTLVQYVVLDFEISEGHFVIELLAVIPNWADLLRLRSEEFFFKPWTGLNRVV